MGKSKKEFHPKKRNKQILVFDEHLRRDYLSGFSRRKQHRKRVAREQIVSRANEAKKLVKEKYREILNHATPSSTNDIADIPQECDATVYDLPEHTVTVTDVTFVDLSGRDGHMLGQNTFDDEDDDDDDEDGDEESTLDRLPADRKPVRCIMKSLRGELTKLEVEKQNTTKKRGKVRKKGPLKKGAHKRRNNKR